MVAKMTSRVPTLCIAPHRWFGKRFGTNTLPRADEKMSTPGRRVPISCGNERCKTLAGARPRRAKPTVRTAYPHPTAKWIESASACALPLDSRTPANRRRRDASLALESLRAMLESMPGTGTLRPAPSTATRTAIRDHWRHACTATTATPAIEASNTHTRDNAALNIRPTWSRLGAPQLTRPRIKNKHTLIYGATARLRSAHQTGIPTLDSYNSFPQLNGRVFIPAYVLISRYLRQQYWSTVARCVSSGAISVSGGRVPAPWTAARARCCAISPATPPRGPVELHDDAEAYREDEHEDDEDDESRFVVLLLSHIAVQLRDKVIRQPDNTIPSLG
ncbi:hypothetical protein MSAN_00734900 [Mycena sanguinolenta]|uniref:Uncharacterized protein n=1 Tax=Mycena sanguinolenta TaxID=230812 RepID=A0A8H7DFD2_9AGAR|nr:hypothetical protein MSAN_00734900 [Mycena sanguinolenta]